MKFTTILLPFAALFSTALGLAQVSTNCPAPGEPCPEDGAIICSADGKSFSVCTFGCTVAMGSVADGTRCDDGSIIGAAAVEAVSRRAGQGNVVNVDAWNTLLTGGYADSSEEAIQLITGDGFELVIGGVGEDIPAAGNLTARAVTGRRGIQMPHVEKRARKKCPTIYINKFGPYALPC